MKMCDYCFEQPVTKKRHPAKHRLCAGCEKRVTVDETGKFTPRTFNEFVVMAANDCVEAS